MTINERNLWNDKCGELLYLVLVDIRTLSWEPDNSKLIEKLADLSHNLPHFMIGRHDAAIEYVRDEFIEMSKERWPSRDPASTKYVELIDMDEKRFNDAYRQTSWAWPEPESVSADH